MGSLVVLSTGDEEGRGSKRKRRAVSHDATVNKMLSLSNETHDDARDSSAVPAFLRKLE